MADSLPGDIRPGVLVNRQGHCLGSLLFNTKAAQKTVEQGAVWYFHGETGRVLPWQLPGGEEPRLIAFRDEGSWLKITVNLSEGVDTGLSGTPVKPTTAAAEPTGSTVSAVPSDSAGVLESLAAVIAQRHRDMPEGSYTTHLFSKGLDKIRKKTGEEAVELILARDKGEIRYEAADLIYHMLVLLEAEGIPLAEILGELKSRE